MYMTARSVAVFVVLFAARPAFAAEYRSGARATLLRQLRGGLAHREQALAAQRLPDGREIQLGLALSSPRGEIVMPLRGAMAEPLAVRGRVSRAALAGLRGHRRIAEKAGVALLRDGFPACPSRPLRGGGVQMIDGVYSYLVAVVTSPPTGKRRVLALDPASRSKARADYARSVARWRVVLPGGQPRR